MAAEVESAGLAMPEEETGSSRIAALTRQAQAGNREAFEELLALHERQVFATAARLLGRREEARDAAQEVFLRLFRHLGRLKSEDTIGPWLYRVTVNVCHDLVRRRRQGEARLEEPEDLAAPRENAQCGLELEERREVLARALGRLAFKERAAVVLRDIEGLTTEETARILGSSPTTVRSQISVARMKLRRFCAAALGGRR